MEIESIFSARELEESAKRLFAQERAIDRLDGWFVAKELSFAEEEKHADKSNIEKKALALARVCRELPLSLSDDNVFAGTQRDAFAKSYALINPNFKVSAFNGYCDPSAVFNDIEPCAQFPAERINAVREKMSRTPYVAQLQKVYAEAEADTAEVAYFIEQVTGHLIPDFRPALRLGTKKLAADLEKKLAAESEEEKRDFYRAAIESLKCAGILAQRYSVLAEQKAQRCEGKTKDLFLLMARTLKSVPEQGAKNLYEAIQSFLLLWQVMCLEQAPNPFAFSVGNADRLFEPYRQAENTARETAAGLFKHFLVFFNVGDRSWAISQNVLLGGKSCAGQDLTSPTTYAILDAYYAMNLPQPILSVKLHSGTPDTLYEEMGRFFFSPGVLTPSLFNDDVIFPMLQFAGVDGGDLEDYAVAGCQEPLIMGRDNGNTTNSWLNLAKILELTLTGGKSLLTKKQIGPSYADLGEEGFAGALKHIKENFYKNAEYFIGRMASAANGASRALSHLPVPFLSCFMGGMESGIDLRDAKNQGTKYNGSGCLIHGLSVVADSFVAIERLLKEKPQLAQRLLPALENNFEGYDDVKSFLCSCEKYGNNLVAPDNEAAELARKISDMVAKQKNYLGNPFRPDWSSPTTHLLYGYWVGASCDGRSARDMLGYGVDPLYGEATSGLGLRLLSAYKLPYDKFSGGYASHIGLDPAHFKAQSVQAKGLELKDKVLAPLFFSTCDKPAPFYVYFNVATPDTLRRVLENPKKYAPSGVYIMRIHGTFVNFLDLSPDVQQDIIKRLDLGSTSC